MNFRVFCVFFVILTPVSFSQGFLERTAEKTANKIKQRAENRVDRGIDKALDKTEKEIENSVKGEPKTEKSKSSDSEPASNSGSDKTNGKSTSSSETNTVTTLKSYSKFDFVSGENVIGYEDFSQDAVGDFPDKWNTNSSGEIVTFDGKTDHFFKLANAGIFYPEYIQKLPENFTLEYDIASSEDFSEMQSGLKLIFLEETKRNLNFDLHFDNSPQVGVDIHPSGSGGYSVVWVCDKSKQKILDNNARLPNWKVGQINRVSIWRQKNRLRVYLNETKIWDIPRAFLPDVNYAMMFGTKIFHGDIYISNLRIAEGLPDTRNKLLTDGKIVSRGIFFDVNSDKIKPESYGALQDISKTLKEVPDVRVKIVGHTDSDGDDAKNLELSLKRANAVKLALINEFGIQSSALETDGKGESEPVDKNNTPVGKANNRRVEFIKL